MNGPNACDLSTCTEDLGACATGVAADPASFHTYFCSLVLFYLALFWPYAGPMSAELPRGNEVWRR